MHEIGTLRATGGSPTPGALLPPPAHFMLDFADLPYRFIPPKPNALVIALAKLVNRGIALPGRNHRLTGIDLHGSEAFAAAKRTPGARFLLLPNHSSHSDPQVMTEVCRRLGVTPAFMAAYDVFARGKIRSWVMQRCGAFSVDREGSDRKSMRCATEILTAGRHSLVLFPEGNVYLCNDRVTPFAEGAAYIALRAQKALDQAAPVYAIPVSLKFTFVEDVREPVRSALHDLAGLFGTQLDRESPVTAEITRISTSALARFLKHRGYHPPGDDLDTDQQIRHSAEQIIESLESKMELPVPTSANLMTRVRRIRAAVHAVRTDPKREIDHRAASHWADEAMLALRILGYHGGYTASNPTLDRVAETVVRLREDVTSRLVPPDGKRRCLIQIGAPIDLRTRLDAFRADARGAIAELTELCEAEVQAGIDAINSSNQEPGSEPF
ncbi:MAG: 1-acyl-sn-glycerol-3-phosphate acyltransferase [Akkermansiaceae bacterium]|nr:1-acyl-sn-glycerol-3-phosphate acyltransferase [Akkermansiaceae bacterium]